MSGVARRIAPLLLVVAGAFPARAAAATWARFESTPPAAPPAISGFTAWWTESPDETGDATLAVEFRSGGSSRGTLWIVGKRAELAAGRPENGSRYIRREAAGPPREWVRRRDGTALLPDPAILRPLLPRGTWGAAAFPESTAWLGRTMHPAERGAGEAPPVPTDPQRIVLDDDVYVATSRDFRDDGTGRHPESGGLFRRGPTDYRYRALDRDDYRAMIDAGFNLFRVSPRQRPWIAGEAVWFVVEAGFASVPDVVFDPAFLGPVMYMDEPAWRLLDTRLAASLERPADAATLLVELTRGRWEGDGPYGSRRLERRLVESGVAARGLAPLRTSFPSWEAVPSAVWYEMEAGIPGVCLQGRVRPDRFARLVREELGVSMPDDADSQLRFDLAWLTGAARRFGAPWGMSVYGQMEPGAAERALPLAYDLGATWLWLWTSGQDHHVPWDRQLELVRALRDHVAAHPRGAIPAPAVAVALPWGYLFDEFCLAPPGGGQPRLWNSPGMELQARGESGERRIAVLRATARVASERLAAGEPFDFVFLRPGEEAAGYEQVFRVLETGEVVKEGDSR